MNEYVMNKWHNEAFDEDVAEDFAARASTFYYDTFLDGYHEGHFAGFHEGVAKAEDEAEETAYLADLEREAKLDELDEFTRAFHDFWDIDNDWEEPGEFDDGFIIEYYPLGLEIPLTQNNEKRGIIARAAEWVLERSK